MGTGRNAGLDSLRIVRHAAAAVLAVAAACTDAGPPAAPPPGSSPPPPVVAPSSSFPSRQPSFSEFPVGAGEHPHDVAPALDGRVWYTAQRSGELGLLDPATGKTRLVSLGRGSAPHGVIVGPDGAAWVTDSGLNAIVRVDSATLSVRSFPLPGNRDANLNTATFDGRGTLWFTGQAGVYGSLDRATGSVRVYDAPKGSGPYGIATAPDGTAWFSSLAGSYIARIDSATGRVTTFDVPTRGGGARRVWSDSQGRQWVTEWFAGKLGRFDPVAGTWREWRLPGSDPQPYAVYVDERDSVWITDFGSNAFVRFDPSTERFTSFAVPTRGSAVRQLLGRRGEIWGAESGTEKLVVLRT